ncbi:MAG: transposase, partial [Fimbriiglobus sp.]
TDVVYGITSLSPGPATAAELWDVGRSHWGIENGLHSVRDEAFGEDRCRTRRGHAARVLASVRNVALHLLRQQEAASVPAAIREVVARPDLAVAMLNAPAPTSE